MTDTQVTWLTQEAYDRLKAELDQLIANRPVIAAEINDRREEGDLRENGGYHAAREEQGKQEGRIQYLKEFLRNAEVGEAQKADAVGPGSVVTIYFDDDQTDTETFLLGSREFDPVNVGFKSDGYPGFVFRTDKMGNSNAGHEYGTRDSFDRDGNKLPALTEQQRWDLIEYIKSL